MAEKMPLLETSAIFLIQKLKWMASVNTSNFLLLVVSLRSKPDWKMTQNGLVEKNPTHFFPTYCLIFVLACLEFLPNLTCVSSTFSCLLWISYILEWAANLSCLLNI